MLYLILLKLELSKRVSEQIQGQGINAVEEVIDVLLTRNSDWIRASKEALIDIVYPSEAEISDVVVRQRKAFDAASRKSVRSCA